MIRGSRFVIAVHDLERSARYYGEVLGFEIRGQRGSDPENFLFRRLRLRSFHSRLFLQRRSRKSFPWKLEPGLALRQGGEETEAVSD